MARQKQANPMRRAASGQVMDSLSNGSVADKRSDYVCKSGPNPTEDHPAARPKNSGPTSSKAGILQLVVCVAGIYASLYVIS
jgi:hypothetical protein